MCLYSNYNYGSLIILGSQHLFILFFVTLVRKDLLVELQRRKGCSVTFHNYRRCILDAAEGKFDPVAFEQTDGLEKPMGTDRCNQPRASLGRPGLARPSLTRPTLSPPSSPVARASPFGAETSPSISRPSLRCPSYSADDALMPTAGLKTEGGSSVSIENETTCEEKALKALNMAASLIKKDRMDARRLGMESLVLLTDPMRASLETAKIASQVVLLGSSDIENVATEGSADDDKDEADAVFNESSGLGIREAILEIIMDDGDAQDFDDDSGGFRDIEKEFTDSLSNLCLTVLSNALYTIEQCAKAPVVRSISDSSCREQCDGSIEGDQKPSPNDSPSPNRRRAATEPSVLSRNLSKRFIDDTHQTFGCDVLSSLIGILGEAKSNPHDAYHSARCLGVLFKGCGNSHKARARNDLDAKRIIAAALEVGSRTHAKLEDASRVAMMALVTDDEESFEEEEQTQAVSPTAEIEDGSQTMEKTQEKQDLSITSGLAETDG